jgi:hypothetical protein
MCNYIIHPHPHTHTHTHEQTHTHTQGAGIGGAAEPPLNSAALYYSLKNQAPANKSAPIEVPTPDISKYKH